AHRANRVLLVDDNRDAVDMLVDVMNRAGIETVGATTPAEALEVAVRLRPQVAVLDIGLPGMSGYDLGRELRRMLSPEPLRLIALCGYGQTQDVAAGRAGGFDVFLVKPVDAEVLMTTLDVQTSTAK